MRLACSPSRGGIDALIPLPRFAKGQAMTDQSNKAVWVLQEELKRIENFLENATASRNQWQVTVERLKTEVIEVKGAIDTLLRDSAPEGKQ
jgi:hypothetical protein